MKRVKRKKSLFMMLLLGLLFGGCSESPYGPPLESTCETKTIELAVRIYSNSTTLNAAKQRLDPGSPLVNGFATMQVGADKHTLHVLAPKGRFDDEAFYLWGHELGHAICGPWHPEGVRR